MTRMSDREEGSQSWSPQASLTCNRCGNVLGTRDFSLASFCDSPAQKDILHWSLFLVLWDGSGYLKYMWLKYSRNIRVIKRSRATGYPIPYPNAGCTNLNVECRYKCLIYTLSQSNQPRGMLTEFSMLSIDLDFLQEIVFDSILKTLSGYGERTFI